MTADTISVGYKAEEILNTWKMLSSIATIVIIVNAETVSSFV